MYTNEIKALFGKEKLSVPNFKKVIEHLPLEEQQRWKEKIFITSFCHYHHKGDTFKAFLKTFTTSYRQEYLNYIVQQTLLGEERFPLSDECILRKIIAFMEKGNAGSPKRNLAFRFLLAFKLKDPVTIDTLCNQMLKEPITPK